MGERSERRVAVVGCGAVTERFYRPALEESDLDGDEVVFVDTDVERAKRMADGLAGASVAETHEAVTSEVDGAIIAVPHEFHHPLALDFISDGAHVLVEKPLAVTGEQATELVRAAAEAGVEIAVNNTRRLFPTTERIRSLVGSGELGALTRIHVEEGNDFSWPTSSGFYFTSDEPKGVVLDWGPHVFDQICWWTGEQPTLRSSRDDSRGGSEAVATIDFEVGERASGHVRLSWLSRLANVWYVGFENGHVVARPDDWETLEITRLGETEHVTVESEYDTYYDFGRPVVQNFVDVLNGDASPLVPGESVVDSIEFIDRCYAARESFELPWLSPRAGSP